MLDLKARGIKDDFKKIKTSVDKAVGVTDKATDDAIDNLKTDGETLVDDAKSVVDDIGAGVIITAVPPAGLKTSLPTGEVIDITFFEKFMNLAHAAYHPDTINEDGDTGYIVVATISDSASENYAYLSTNSDLKRIVVSFRGTVITDTSNIIEDLDDVKSRWADCKCKVDEGFDNALQSIYDDTLAALDTLHKNNPTYGVYVTGHSLGAAMATLFSLSIKLLGYDPYVITFGSPRVGNKNFAAYFNSKLYYYYRVHLELDPVPLLPTTSAHYEHCGQLVYFKSYTSWANYGFIDIVGTFLYVNIVDHLRYWNIGT